MGGWRRRAREKAERLDLRGGMRSVSVGTEEREQWGSGGGGMRMDREEEIQIQPSGETESARKMEQTYENTGPGADVLHKF